MKIKTILAAVLMCIALQGPCEAKKLSERAKANKLLGVWNLYSSDEQVTMRIRRIAKTVDPNTFSFLYSTEIDGQINDYDLLGFVIHGQMFFNIFYGDGVSLITVTVHRGYQDGQYSDIFMSNGSPSQIGFVRFGTIHKESK
jgi:hypothetical protein